MAKPSMAEQAYSQIKSEIIQAKLRPGITLSDAELAEKYSMSRTPVREAFNMLRREGLVVVRPKRGTFVKPIDFSEIQDLYALRKMIEPEAAVLASVRMSSEQLEELAELSELSMNQTANIVVLNERNAQLHVRIAEFAGIPLLADTVRSIHEEIERCLNLRMVVGRPVKALNHGRLVGAIASSDPENIRATALNGIEHARVHMMNVLTNYAGQDARWEQ